MNELRLEGGYFSIRAGLAVLAVLEEDRLQENALRVGEYLLAKLRALQVLHPFLGDVRGLGLMVGIECVTDGVTKSAAPVMARYIRVRCSPESHSHDNILLSKSLANSLDGRTRLMFNTLTFTQSTYDKSVAH